MPYNYYNKKLIPRAKELRKNMTRQEKHLWYDFLRYYPLHVYKQRVIENYIVDFYCPAAHLVIEVDGSQHYTIEGMKYDAVRTEILERHKLKVLRVSNVDVDRNFSGVCKMIEEEINKRISCSPSSQCSPS
jgi:very-short-patch-repair endonuclease